LDIKKIEKIVLETNWRRVFSLLDPHLTQGLIGGEKVKKFIESYIKRKKFEDCHIKFAAVATDLKTGEIVTFKKGKMAEAIRASISIPLFFKPVEIGGRTLADGGLSAPVPVEIVRKMGADIVIAVNLDKHYHDENSKFNMYGIANDSLDILRHNLALANVASADVIIDIDLSKNYWYEFINGQTKISTGEKAAKKILPILQKIIKQKSSCNTKNNPSR
jgi:NTE family protein